MSEIQEHDSSSHHPTAPESQVQKSRFLHFWQLFCLTVMVLLAAKGLAGVGDIAFVVLCPVYLYMFISRFSFPRKQIEQKRRLSNPSNKLFQAYFLATAVIDLLLPVAYIADGIFRGDVYGTRAAAPHLFLLCGQVFFERFGFSERFSMPISVLGPIFSNSRRIFVLLDWLKDEFSSETPQRRPVRMFEGRLLASVNVAVWLFNLFGLLLPVYLPRACKIHFFENKID